jgi:hypothetical protein
LSGENISFDGVGIPDFSRIENSEFIKKFGVLCGNLDKLIQKAVAKKRTFGIYGIGEFQKSVIGCSCCGH